MQNNNVVQPHIGYLIEGLDQVGTFVDTNNIASNWQPTDWGAATAGCDGVTWPPTAKVAHHPSMVAAGYTDLRIHCER